MTLITDVHINPFHKMLAFNKDKSHKKKKNRHPNLGSSKRSYTPFNSKNTFAAVFLWVYVS